MKLTLSILLLVISVNTPTLPQIRAIFQQAGTSSTAAFQLVDQLANINQQSNPTLLAYKGAALTMKAKYVREKEAKKQNFKEGVKWIESAVTNAPQNIEIRLVRLAIQENTPKFLKYHSDIQTDKAFILSHLSQVKTPALRQHIQTYVAQSKVFSASEKEMVKAAN